MGLRGKKTTEKSLKIIALIEKGESQLAIKKMGYPPETVRYYWRKMNRPRAFKRFIKQIKGYNQAYLDKRSK